ncbi:phosphonoacetaldehyde hydrolase [Halobacillus halophilus]|uniref:phosphonoacetaldehyde hydrolase n=1 Tax=Halobacillus halophilus TaxID=1570 RepID=UPI001CD29654|nr:phosphonoacetaldehyde hydrolase [Halobacillus halophilus]MCA1011230.1 phosphonoacetaldehyde hydrolase [Halobacillus halophilus]
MNPRIEGVIFDWAGTTVDYGCFAPVQVFMEVFYKRGVSITYEEARGPMGLLKVDHIRAICEMDRVKTAWREAHGKNPDETDVRALYDDFEPMLFRILDQYADPIPGVIDVMDQLREKNIRIGSTTGYTGDMIEIVSREAAKKGYVPDSIVTSTDVPAGRPYPWMCFQNAINLNVYPMLHMIKVGDTTSDMQEGVNAGMWTVGVVKGSNILGRTEHEVQTMDSIQLKQEINQSVQYLKNAGADYVIEDITMLPEIVEMINKRLNSCSVSYA